jgi:hypothetical protein
MKAHASASSQLRGKEEEMEVSAKALRRLAGLSALLASASLLAVPSHAESEVHPATSQTVYVPVYSNVFHGNHERPFHLNATLSIRSTDLEDTMTLVAVDYYDTKGKLLERYLEKPLEIGPLASVHYSIKESDEAGGFGANFLVRWKSSKAVNEPVIECVMISTRGQQGISFITQGRVIQK